MDYEKQLKIIISQILIAKGFYFLNYKSLSQILTLLGKQQTPIPAAIQQLAFQGLMDISYHDQITIQRSFSEPHFSTISNWSKEFLKNIVVQVIATKHTLLKNMSSKNLARAMPEMNYTLLPFNGYPQMGFLNTANAMGQNMITHGSFTFPPQIPIGYGHIYSQNLINNSHQQNIKQQLQEEMQKLENSRFQQRFQRQIDKKEQVEEVMQDGQEEANESQNINQNQQKNYQEKNISENQRYELSQQNNKNAGIGKEQNKKQFSSFQIQTDLSLIFNGLKIKKKKYILKQKLATKIKRKYIRRKPRCYQIRQKQPQKSSPQKHSYQSKNLQMIEVQENVKEVEKNVEDIGKDLVEGKEMFQQKEIREYPYEQKEENKYSNNMQVERSNLQHSHQQMSLEVSPYNRVINLDSSSHRFINENQLQKIDMLEINQHNQHCNSKNKFEKCACFGLFYSINIFTCQKCNNNFHIQCLMNKSHQNFYKIECPICKLRSIDPLQEVISVIGQFFVKDINSSKFSTKVDFSNYTHILQNQQKNKHKRYQGKDIQIRCLKLEKNYQRTEITWPDQVTISVNGYKVTETYGLLLTSSNKKRLDQSIVITQQALKTQEACSQSETFEEVVIEMQYKKLGREELQRKQIDNNHIYLFGIYYISRVKVSDLYQSILDHITPFEKTYIKNNLFDYEIDKKQIIIDFMTCKLRDPYSGQLMKLPVRAKDCTHPQCFDLKTFIFLIWNSKSRLWRCPVCAKQAKYFRVDQKQLQMIKRCEQYKVIPEELIFMNKGDIIFKIQMDDENEMVRNLIEDNLDENQKEKNNPQKNRQTEKSYKYFEYFPNIQFLEVTFTSKQCFRARKLEKQRILQRKKRQEIQQQNNKSQAKIPKRGKRK